MGLEDRASLRCDVPQLPYLARFGQRKGHTCGVACLCYVLSCYGVNYTEEQLLGVVIEENENGNTVAELAEAVNKLGFVPYARCLSRTRHLIGELREEWVQEGSEKEMEEWLRHVVQENKRIIVSLDTRQLGPPYNSKWGGYHSVVVISVRGDVVEFLDPDPPQENSYPKQSRPVSIGFGNFMKSWGSVAYIALFAVSK